MQRETRLVFLHQEDFRISRSPTDDWFWSRLLFAVERSLARSVETYAVDSIFYLLNARIVTL